MPTQELSPHLHLHYLDENPGGSETVLLLHGLGATTDSWQMQIPALVGAGFRVLAPDARGFGRSTCPYEPLSIRLMAADITGLLHALQVHRAHVVGISMGGTLALQLTIDEPSLVDHLVLVNTFAYLRPQSVHAFFTIAARFFLVHTFGLPAQARFIARRLFPDPNQAELRRELVKEITTANPYCYRAALRALARFDCRSRLAEIQAPTLVITAENDHTVPPQAQQHLARGIRTASQMIIPGAGHAVTVDQPARFNEILLAFLKQKEAVIV